ncbi:T9SS type A sorting domain-containing protein [Aquimarina sp. 2304DJ70-9]|uniref:T9SS type A sorting domain-containing protein n=1 Tax=Aquimarina penaris TaxID=3231044 RepID=UPI003461F1CE
MKGKLLSWVALATILFTSNIILGQCPDPNLDDILPTPVCKSISIQLDASGQATITTADIDNGSTDNCGIADMELSITQFDCSNIGDNNVTLTIEDTNGNRASCDAIVTVAPAAPIVVCDSITIELDASGNATISATDLDGGSYDPCGGSLHIEIDQSSFDCTNLYDNMVMVTVTNDYGLQDSCMTIVEVEDVTIPNAVCQNITIQLDAAGNTVNITADDIDGGSSDNCDSLSLLIDTGDATFTSADIGTTRTVELIVDDDFGNMDSCFAQVTVVTYEPPVITCPIDITINNETGTCSADVTIPMPTITGTVDQSLVPMTERTSLGPDLEFLLDVHTIMYNAVRSTSDVTIELEVRTRTAFNNADECFVLEGPDGSTVFSDCNLVGFNQNGFSATFTVDQSTWNTWVDTYGSELIFTLQEDTDVFVVAFNSSNTFWLIAPDLGNIMVTNNVTNFNDASGSYSGGVREVIWTVTDQEGNSDTCTQTITVSDSDDPVAVCQDITVSLDETGQGTIDASQIDNGSSDNCDIDTYSLDVDTFDCTNLGSNTVTLTVTDTSGNTTTCTATVTVEDNVAPEITYDGIYGTGTQENPFTSLNAPELETLPNGVYYFTFNGNTFQGQTDSDIDGKKWLIVLNYVHQGGTNPDLVVRNTDLPLLSSTTLGDDESGTEYWGHFGNTLAADIDFEEMRFYGESASHSRILSFTTTLESALDYVKTGLGDFDRIEINFTALSDHTAELPAEADEFETDSGDEAFTDYAFYYDGDFEWNIKGDGDRWAMDDVPTNFENNTIHRVWVRGDLSPTLSPVLLEINVQLDDTGNITLVPSDFPITVSDNCVSTTLSLSQTDFDCSNVGANIIQYIVTDGSGNQTSVDVVVNIEDITAPVVACKDITIALGINGSVSITAADIDRGSSDTCGIDRITLDKTEFISTDLGENIVTLTVADLEGNESTCTAIVTVLCPIYDLPANNFTIATSSETCTDKNNGTITINAGEELNYIATINNQTYTFTSNLVVPDLAPDTYKFCIAIDGITNCEQCFELTIEEADVVAGKTTLNTNTMNVEMVSGTAPYTAMINDKVVGVYSDNDFTVEIQHGDVLNVFSSLSCEGKLSTKVDLLDSITIAPNPTRGDVVLTVPNTGDTIGVTIHNALGTKVSSKAYSITNGKVMLPMQSLSAGIYFVRIHGTTPKTFKIIKQ